MSKNKAIEAIKDNVDSIRRFAKKHEVSLLAICLLFIKNHRKRPFHMGFVGKAVFYLTLLYGLKKETAKKIGVCVNTVRAWILVAGVGSRDEFERYVVRM